MIPYLLRELTGWALTLVGLSFCAFSLYFLLEPRHKIIEGGIAATMGLVIFRAGISLQKSAVAARVIERHAGFVDPASGCLSRDQYAGARIELHDGPGPEWKICRAYLAGANLR